LSSYAEKLRDPRWQRRRLEVLERDEWMCRSCFSTAKTLHVHHTRYVGRDPWDTPPDLLVTLCESCHEIRTLAERRLRELVANLPLGSLGWVVKFAELLAGRADDMVVRDMYDARLAAMVLETSASLVWQMASGRGGRISHVELRGDPLAPEAA
jgi:hypothetical protein